MAFTTYITVATGDPWSAANNNTYNRDNVNALWPYTTAGDLAYASNATNLARLALTVGGILYGGASAPAWLAKPSVASLLQNDNAGIPSWIAKTSVGGIHAKGTVDFSPGGQTFTAWADITGATFNLTLTVQCTIVVLAIINGYQGTAGNGIDIRAVVNSVADAGPPLMGNGGAVRNEALPYIYWVAGIAAGTRTVKLQAYGGATTAYVQTGRLMAFAFAEA